MPYRPTAVSRPREYPWAVQYSWSIPSVASLLGLLTKGIIRVNSGGVFWDLDTCLLETKLRQSIGFTENPNSYLLLMTFGLAVTDLFVRTSDRAMKGLNIPLFILYPSGSLCVLCPQFSFFWVIGIFINGAGIVSSNFLTIRD